MISEITSHPSWGFDYRAASFVCMILIVAFSQLWIQGKLGKRNFILLGLGFGLVFSKGFYVWIFAGPIILLRLSVFSGSAGRWGPFFGEFLLIAGIVLPGQMLWVSNSRIYLLAAALLAFASAKSKSDSRGLEYGALPLIIIAGAGLSAAGPAVLLAWVAAGSAVYIFLRGKSTGPAISFASGAVIFGQGPVIGLGAFLLFYTSDLLNSRGTLGKMAGLALWSVGIGLAMPGGAIGYWIPWVILSVFVPSIYLSRSPHSDGTKSMFLTGSLTLGVLFFVLTSGLIRLALYEFLLDPKSLVILAAIFAVPVVLAMKNSLDNEDALFDLAKSLAERFGRKPVFASFYDSEALKQAAGYVELVSSTVHRRIIISGQQLLSFARLRNASNNFSQSANHQSFMEILFLVSMIFIGLL